MKLPSIPYIVFSSVLPEVNTHRNPGWVCMYWFCKCHSEVFILFKLVYSVSDVFCIGSAAKYYILFCFCCLIMTIFCLWFESY